jgi:hypothetical protein
LDGKNLDFVKSNVLPEADIIIKLMAYHEALELPWDWGLIEQFPGGSGRAKESVDRDQKQRL